MTLPIYQISIGDRHRQDLGDLDALAKNITEVGLLHPIVITPAGDLIAGRRRLEACRLLGWESIPVTVIDLEDLLFGEWSENEMRKDFTLEERLAIGRALEVKVSEKARANLEASHHLAHNPDGTFTGSDESSEPVRVRDVVGKAIGMGGGTYQKARDVQRAAEADPSLAPIAEKMFRTGKVEPAFRQVRVKPPPPSFKSPEAIRQRREIIEKMAREGYRAQAIAVAVGTGTRSVIDIIHELGLETVTDRIGKAARIDVNRIMDSLTSNATPPDEAIAAINGNWEALDHSKFAGWSASLTIAINAYRRLRDKLREDTDGNSA